MSQSSRPSPSFSRRQAVALFGALGVGALLPATPLLSGTRASAAETGSTALVDGSTLWRYLDTGADPAAGLSDVLAWTTASYDDSSWSTGTGGFGSKNGSSSGIGGGYTITTQLNQYLDDGKDVPTFFFRTSFELTAEQLAEATTLTGTLVYDDAAIVYLGGERVVNYEADDIDTSVNVQYGGSNGSDPRKVTFSIDTAKLVEGTNTIAVAIYQCNSGSSDIYFDLSDLTLQTSAATAELSDVVLCIGADQSSVGVAWYASLSTTQQLQIHAGTAFDEEKATTIDALSGQATDGQYYQHATATGLEESSSYVYRVGSDGAWSEVYAFSTGAFSGDFSFLLIGDSQIGASGDRASDGAGWADTLEKAEARWPESRFILSAGDQVNTASNEEEYAYFLAPSQLRAFPLVTNIGNHDYASRAYNQHFTMPNEDENYGAGASASYAGGNYWFRYNGVLFISFNSNNQENDAHLEYIRGIVETEKKDADWVVVHFHHSVFSVATHATDSDIIARRAVLPAGLTDIGVDLALMGHDHVYTRSFLMNGATPVADASLASLEAASTAVSGVVVPDEGDVLYLTTNSSSGSKYYEIQDQDFAWSAVQNQEHVPNITNVQVTASAITLTTHRTTDMTVVDEVILQKPDTTAPVISLPDSAEVVKGASFDPLAGVTAVDDRDGDLTSAITVDGTVDVDTIGSYTLTYSVADAAGNAASVVRTVSVVAAPTDGGSDDPDDSDSGSGDSDGADDEATGTLPRTGADGVGLLAGIGAAALAAGGGLYAASRLRRPATVGAAAADAVESAPVD